MSAGLGGYAGKILHIDLTRKEAVRKDLDFEVAKRFIGGRGLGAKILYDLSKLKTDPLSPDNILVFATGPLTGTTAPGSKMSLVAKSPLTSGYADSTIGGFLGAEIKFAGYDAIVIHGKSQNPTYVWIEDGSVRFRDAVNLWGKGCFTTETEIKEELGDKKVRVASIGPAGERLVKIACITHEYGKQAGRCGLGAVMGSKNLKALAARGTGEIGLARPDEFKELADETRRAILANPDALKVWREMGTAHHVIHSNEWGALPTRNYQSGVFEKAEDISGERMKETIVLSNKTCFSCPVACGKWSEVREGLYKGTAVEGPEYETIAMLGSNCGVGSLETIARANYLCDDLGIDTISTGNVVAFAMECYEKGVIDKTDTGGLDLRFGNAEAYLRVIEMIGMREGLGATLSEGVRKSAQAFGKGSERFAMHSKGLEWSGYECRGAPGQALAYAIVDRGADHNKAWCTDFFMEPWRYTIEGKPEMAAKILYHRSACDMLGICRFVAYMVGSRAFMVGLEPFVKMLSAATGWSVAESDILRASERVYNLNRAFNIREGFTREHDSVPSRCFDEPVPSGPTEGRRLTRQHFEHMLERFYEVSGWNRLTGFPTRKKLEELDLRDVAEELERMGRL